MCGAGTPPWRRARVPPPDPRHAGRFLVHAALLGVLALVAAGPAAAQRLSGDTIRAEVSGNTLTGYNTSGVVFSEYHSPDGRVFGHNNGVRVIEGCWSIRDDAICYYYAKGQFPRGTFCWRMERAGGEGYRIASLERDTTGAARLDSGNPRNHSDNGETWECEGLVSERPTGKGLAEKGLAGDIRRRFAALRVEASGRARGRDHASDGGGMR